VRANINSAIDTLRHEADELHKRAEMPVCAYNRADMFSDVISLRRAAHVLEREATADRDAKRMQTAKQILSGLPEHLKDACRKILNGEET
jgi:hypothetical protein